MNKVKIGVIGAGWWATENHIPHLAERDEVELTSVCKLEEDQLSFVKINLILNMHLLILKKC